MSDPAKSLRDRLDELSRPRLAKCEPPSRRERGETRAAQCFGGALEACGLSALTAGPAPHVVSLAEAYRAAMRQDGAGARAALAKCAAELLGEADCG